MSLLAPIYEAVHALITRLTTARAAKLDQLDHLDADITTRAPAASAVSNATWTDTRAAKLDQLDHLDADITTRAPATTALSTITWTPQRAANLDRLTADLSTQVSTAATNASLVESRLTATRANLLDALQTGVPLHPRTALITATQDWPVPAGVELVYVTLVGGGGGGGTSDNYPMNASGGGGGCVTRQPVRVVGITSLPIEIGSGGTGANFGASGGAGGTSMIVLPGTVVVKAYGGNGGVNSSTVGLTKGGGFFGATGVIGENSKAFYGGDSSMGSGGLAIADYPGLPGTGYGGGGGGSKEKGGNGAPGVCVIEY